MAGIGGICSYGQTYQTGSLYGSGSVRSYQCKNSAHKAATSGAAGYAGAILSIKRSSEESEKLNRASKMHDLLNSMKQKNNVLVNFDRVGEESADEQIQRILKEQDLNYDIRITNYRDDNDSFIKLSAANVKNKESQIPKPLKYNYREVATKILRAKTSQSAGQALLCAKRKVTELKGKISTGDGDQKELELALTHAKKMELLARKKKHDLELEELASVTVERDEREDKTEEGWDDIKNAVISAEEEKVSEKEDEIFEERGEIFEEEAEEFEGLSEDMRDQMLAGLSDLLKDFGEEELEELEKAMETLESAEMIDPHMSREELEELKKEHRNKEMKILVKADMDYLEGSTKLASGLSVMA
ncbi:MAG: hypothetical protein K6G22_01985 [Lachnospiraceae bacterium]|nr:hypothetical protein [Lachnospiraceae bacterium]